MMHRFLASPVNFAATGVPFRTRNVVSRPHRLLGEIDGNVAKPHQFLVLLVPKTIAKGLQTRPQRDVLHRLEHRMGFVALLQVVVRNSRAQMVKVVEPDATAEPLEDARQLVERRPLECVSNVTPLLVVLPIGVLELVLYIEKPNAGRARDNYDG